MSTVKKHLNDAIVVMVEGKMGKNGKKGVKRMRLSRIIDNANDEDVRNAGEALASLQKNAFVGIQKVEVSQIMEA